MVGQNMKAIAALATAGVALIVVVVSMATEYWATTTLQDTGLWRICVKLLDTKVCISPYEPASWFVATQAAVCLDFIANLGAVVALGLLTFASSLPEKILKTSTLVFLGFSFFWSVIAIVVFGVKQGSNLDWSWGIMILAAILQAVSLVLTILVTRE